MKRLKVDIEELSFALDSRDLSFRHFLNTETGEYIFVTDDDDYDEFEFEDDHFEPLPSLKTWEVHNLRVRFAETRKNDTLKEALMDALSGKGAFGRFKRTLENFPGQDLDEWFKFEQEYLNTKVVEWLTSLGIEPVK